MLHGIWDVPGPGIEPMVPTLAGGFLSTAPPKKSCLFFKSTSFIISLKVGLVVTILSLPSSENVWISPLYLKGIFAGHGVLVQMFLFFIFLISAVEMSATSFWPLWFKMRNPLSF